MVELAGQEELAAQVDQEVLVDPAELVAEVVAAVADGSLLVRV
jgi:hypothetical protein